MCIYRERHSGYAEEWNQSSKDIKYFSYLNKSKQLYSGGKDVRKIAEAHKEVEYWLIEVSQTESWLLIIYKYKTWTGSWNDGIGLNMNIAKQYMSKAREKELGV